MLLDDERKNLLAKLISEQVTETELAAIPSREWDVLVKSAQLEGVAPLLYWLLSNRGALQNLSEKNLDFLKASYAFTWLQNQRFLDELDLLMSRYRQANIPVVALKGICFAITIYPMLGLRPMEDIDLLIPERKLVEASSIAHSLGFVEKIPEALKGLRDLLNHEIFLQKNGPFQITLELHRSLVAGRTYAYAVPMDWFWEQTEPMSGQIEGLLMLTPTAQLLYAAVHATLQHGGERTTLRWYYDMDRLIRMYVDRIDWNLLLAQSFEFQWGSALEAALNQTGLYFNSPVPEYVLKELSSRTDKNRKFITQKQTIPSTHILAEWQKLTSLNFKGRLRLLVALVVPNPDYMRWRYQTQGWGKLPYFYCLRWWGIIKDGIRTAVVLLKKLIEK